MGIPRGRGKSAITNKNIIMTKQDYTKISNAFFAAIEEINSAAKAWNETHTPDLMCGYMDMSITASIPWNPEGYPKFTGQSYILANGDVQKRTSLVCDTGEMYYGYAHLGDYGIDVVKKAKAEINRIKDLILDSMIG